MEFEKGMQKFSTCKVGIHLLESTKIKECSAISLNSANKKSRLPDFTL